MVKKMAEFLRTNKISSKIEDLIENSNLTLTVICILR